MAWLALTACTPVAEGTDIDGDGEPDVPTLDIPSASAGCTLGLGWWKNHHDGAKGDRDLAWPISEDTALCGQSLLDILDAPTKGDAWNILAKQHIPASLNAANGAAVPLAVGAALADGADLLQACEITDDDRDAALALKDTLESYNQGELGPGACDSDSGPAVPTGLVDVWIGDGTTSLASGGSGGANTEDVEAVYFTVRTLALNSDTGWSVVSDDSWMIDAMAAVPEPTLLVAGGAVPLGAYSEVRMELVWVNMMVAGELVDVDPASYGGDPLIIPAAFDVMDCGVTTVTMAWDLVLLLGPTMNDLDVELSLTGTPSYDTTGCP